VWTVAIAGLILVAFVLLTLGEELLAAIVGATAAAIAALGVAREVPKAKNMKLDAAPTEL
jgi:hypothetical protein